MADMTETRRRRDFDDHQNEVAGRDTGRISRFGVGAARDKNLKEKERKDRAYRTTLDDLLTDPEYRRLYEELGGRLSAAEVEADTAIAMIEEQLGQIGEKSS